VDGALVRGENYLSLTRVETILKTRTMRVIRETSPHFPHVESCHHPHQSASFFAPSSPLSLLLSLLEVSSSDSLSSVPLDDDDEDN